MGYVDQVSESRMPMNHKGKHGPICNNCGGFGFTNIAFKGSRDCAKCKGTGVNKK